MTAIPTQASLCVACHPDAPQDWHDLLHVLAERATGRRLGEQPAPRLCPDCGGITLACEHPDVYRATLVLDPWPTTVLGEAVAVLGSIQTWSAGVRAPSLWPRYLHPDRRIAMDITYRSAAQTMVLAPHRCGYRWPVELALIPPAPPVAVPGSAPPF